MKLPPKPGPGEVNHDFVDRFTLAHGAVGSAYGALDLSAVAAFALALLWELVENPLKLHLPAVFPHATRDTLRNIVGDVLAVMAGWWLARAWLAGG